MTRLRNAVLVIMLLISVALSILLQGCSFANLKKTEEHLNERVKMYWDAKKSGDFKTAYELEGESIKRQESYEMYFASKFAVKSELENYEISSIQYDKVKEEYVVKIKRKLKLKADLGAINLTDIRGEVWRFENGDWHRNILVEKKPEVTQGKKEQ